MTNQETISGLERLTQNAKNIILASYEYAQSLNAQQVLALHVFITILKQPSSLIVKLLDSVEIDLKDTLAYLQDFAAILTTAKSTEFGENIKSLITDAYAIAEDMQHVYVGTEHLIIAILNKKEGFVAELNQVGLTKEYVSDFVNKNAGHIPGILTKTSSEELEEELEDSDEELPIFCKDMNVAAANNEYMKITGRESEIQRLIHILSRKTKNNPMLVGDAGVGKTAVVQGLVQKMLSGDVPPSFLDKKVISMDVASIVAGARVRGDVEERILNLVNQFIEDEDKILFIDEIHMIVGAGGNGRDNMDIANILKPYLVNPNLRVIGATTSGEYSKYFEEDPALSRRFQPIDVKEINVEDALKVMQALKPEFESYHGVKIKEEALQAAVDLSVKFIPDRYLPDKAIDLLDEAAASVKIGYEIMLEPELTDLGGKLMSVQKKAAKALDNGNLPAASKLKIQEGQISDQISNLMGGVTKIPGKKRQSVDRELVAQVVVNWTKIPLASQDRDNSRLAKIEKAIFEQIVGQDNAVNTVSNGIKRAHLGLSSTVKRPLSSFLFLGPTGVGKTELAKSIAKNVFGNENMLVQINMSEYMEPHSVSKLIGAPPGYVGFQQGGQLTEEIRRKPYSVVLFDEIEKAHPEVLNLLLQILEEGELKDGRGRRAVFTNTIVILTSNIGAEKVAQDRRLGFDVAVKDEPEKIMDQAYTEIKTNLLNELRKQVRPEILNRIDDIVVFRGLNKEDSLKITGIMLKNLKSLLGQSNITLEFDSDIDAFINESGYSKEYGARNIRRSIQTMVENNLANYMIEQNIKLPLKKVLALKLVLQNNTLIFKKN